MSVSIDQRMKKVREEMHIMVCAWDVFKDNCTKNSQADDKWLVTSMNKFYAQAIAILTRKNVTQAEVQEIREFMQSTKVRFGSELPLDAGLSLEKLDFSNLIMYVNQKKREDFGNPMRLSPEQLKEQRRARMPRVGHGFLGHGSKTCGWCGKAGGLTEIERTPPRKTSNTFLSPKLTTSEDEWGARISNVNDVMKRITWEAYTIVYHCKFCNNDSKDVHAKKLSEEGL